MDLVPIAIRVLFGSGVLSPGASLLTLVLVLASAGASAWQRRRLATALSVAVIVIVVVSVFLVQPRAWTQSGQPFPDAFETADAARHLLAGEGYVTEIHGHGPEPPRYPPGFSLLLVPFVALESEFPSNVQHGAAFYAAFYLALAAAAAWTLGGPLAAAIAAMLVGVSPFAKAYSSLILSDALAAGLVILLIVLLQRTTGRAMAFAGLIAGVLVTIRMPMVVVLPALLMSAPASSRKRLFLSALPPLLALAAFQWWTFGSPFQTGYSYWLRDVTHFSPSFALQTPMFGDGPYVVADGLRSLHLRWLCPCPAGGPQAALSNLVYYPSILLGLFWLYAPPLVPGLGFFFMWQRRGDRVVRFSASLIALSLLLFTFYFYQAARFMAAPATLLTVFASVQLSEWMQLARRRRETE